MTPRLIIDGNAVYEIDEDCMRKKKAQEKLEKQEKQLDKNRKTRRRTSW